MKRPQSIQINIPQPCHEDWDKMTPQEQGRFCDSCRKCVVDFTGFSDEELYRFFREHEGEQVCGHVSRGQLNRSISIPPAPPTSYNKWLAAAGLVLTCSIAPESNLYSKTRITVEQPIFPQGQYGGIHTDVYNDHDDPLAGAAILITPAHGGADKWHAKTDSEGHSATRNIQPGYYNITVTSEGSKAVHMKRVLVQPFIITNVRFRLPKGSGNADTLNYEYQPELIGGLIAVSRYLTAEEIEQMPTRSTTKKDEGFFKRFWNKLFD